MQSGFKTILIPVDFTINTEIAVKKALEVADINEATIHLLHVLQENNSLVKDQTNGWMGHTSALEKLTQWKNTIEETLPMLDVCYWIQYGQVQSIIEKKSFGNRRRPDRDWQATLPLLVSLFKYCSSFRSFFFFRNGYIDCEKRFFTP